MAKEVTTEVDEKKDPASVVDPKVQELIDQAVKTKLAEQKTEFEKKLEDERKRIAAIEKDKLYGSIDSLKNENKTVQDKLKAFEEEEKKKKEVEEKKKLDEMDLKERFRLQDEEIKRIKEQSADYIKTLEESTKAELLKRDMEAYRLGIIAQSNGKIIAEMVIGSTKEDIDAAAERAKQKYDFIIKSRDEELKAKTIANGLLPEPDAQNKQQEGNTATMDYYELLGKSPEEFKKLKEERINKFLKQ